MTLWNHIIGKIHVFNAMEDIKDAVIFVSLQSIPINLFTIKI